MPSAHPRWWHRFTGGDAPPPDAPPPDAAPMPVALVTGCPRSGTTALLNWLGEQHGVLARDESRRLIAAHRYLDEVERFTALADTRDALLPALRATLTQRRPADRGHPARLLVEKEPLERIALPDGRFADFLSHARLLFPAIRIVFLVRHPLATVSSMRARRWGHSLAAGAVRDVTLEEAIATWRENAALALAQRDDSAVYLCRYEQLVQDPATVASAVGRHVGLGEVGPFVPRPPRPSVLTATEADYVLERTRAERSALGL